MKILQDFLGKVNISFLNHQLRILILYPATLYVSEVLSNEQKTLQVKRGIVTLFIKLTSMFRA